MEKFLKQQDKERMKRAMLQQEEAFRQQVHELHRLYQVQKKLMKETKIKKLKNHCIPKNMDRTRAHEMLDLELPAETYIKNSAADMEQESEIELTLGTGSSCRKRSEEASNTSDSAFSYSSSSAESGGLKLLDHEPGNPKVQEMYLAAQIDRNNGFNVEHRMMQDRLQQPTWLLPCLSLTMS